METVSNQIFIFIINAVWQISVLLVIALICSRLIRRATARLQHFFWVAVLILSIVLPISSFYNLNDNYFRFGFLPPFKNSQSIVGNTDGADQQKVAEDKISVHTREQFGDFTTIILLLISGGYFSLLIYRLTRLWKNWKRAGRLYRSSKNKKLPVAINLAAERCCAILKINSVPILFSTETDAPLTLGMKNPKIILPESFTDITSEKIITAVLGHELAHIRRGDYGLNLVYEFLSLPVSFHPAVTIMKRKINQTREMACDELVSAHFLKPLDYARSLVQIAGFTSFDSRNALTLGVLNADILEKRIMKLIEINHGANGRVGKLRFLFVVTLLTMTTAAASVFSFALPNTSEKIKDEASPVNNSQTTDSIDKQQQDKRVNKKRRNDENSAVSQKEDGIIPIHFLNRSIPIYPDEARKNGTIGSIRLRVTFLSSGEIGEVNPVNKLPDGLTESAIEAAKNIKFVPATKYGKPLTVTKLIEYSFANF